MTLRWIKIAESAKRHAAVQAELGNTEVFLAANVDGVRVEHPAIGADADAADLGESRRWRRRRG